MKTKAFQKVLLPLLLICICALLFCACGKDPASTTDPATGGAGAGSSSGQTGGGSAGGDPVQEQKSLSFALTSDGAAYEVTGIGTVTDTDIVIPATYSGKPVTAIAENAFLNDTNITSVSLPDSVASIGDSAFSGCTNVTSVTLGNGVTNIGEEAFHKCAKLASITIPGSVTDIGSSAFSDCYELVEVYNLSSLSINAGSWSNGSVGKYAKAIHTSLSEPSILATKDDYTFCYVDGTGYLIGYSGNEAKLVLPSSFEYNGSTVTTYAINQYAIYGNSRLTSVTIPDSVTSIGNYAFTNCRQLVEVYHSGSLNISIDSTSNGYVGYYAKVIHTDLSEQSILTATADGYTFCYVDGTGYLVGYSGGEVNLVLPSSFDYNGSTVTTYEINQYAFYDNTQLASVTIPGSVTAIGTSAFSGCNHLVEVYNLSSLDISAGAWDNGYVGQQAKAVHTSLSEPSILVTKDGYTFYYVDGKGYLLGYSGSETNLVLPSSFAYNGTTVATYAIYPYAFFKNAQLTSVTIPSSVTEIGKDAFYYCTGLGSVTIERGMTSIGENAFYYCKALTSMTLPNTVTSIGEDAFYCCTSLNSVTIPDSVRSIGVRAFYHCIALTSVTIPGTVSVIGEDLFFQCTSLTSATIKSGVTSIGDNAFWYCTSLTSVSIPDSVESIGADAFEYCSALTSVTIPNSVTSIGEGAFRKCTALTSVTLSNTLTSISDNTFEECISLTAVSMPDTLLSIGNYAFEGCTGLTSLQIGTWVKSIGNAAFSGCTGLTSVTIPDDVRSIGNSAFLACTSLTSVEIGLAVGTIGDKAFFGCTNLTCVRNGSIALESIGDRAFYGCYKLIEVYDTHNTQIGATDNGYLGYYAKVVHESRFESSVLTTTADGYIFCSMDGENYLMGYSGSETDLVLPSSFEFGGSNVTTYAIYPYAFYGNKKLTSVTIPDSVTSIGASAFNGCTNLTAVNISTTGWYTASDSDATSGTDVDLSDPATAATCFTSTYSNSYFKRNS